MLKKEFRDIIKPTLVIMCVLLIIPLLQKFSLISLIFGFQSLSGETNIVETSQHFDLFIAALIITFVSGVFGSGMFRTEHKDKAFEYLFASPIPKLKIITFKVVPRLFALVPFLIIYILIFFSHSNNDLFTSSVGTTFLDPKLFIVWIIFIFFVSFFPSIFISKNWIAITSLVSLISVFVFPVAIKKVLIRSDFQFINLNNIRIVSFFAGIIIVFAISAIAFFFTYKDFDLKEQSFKGNKYSMISLIPQVVFLSISIAVFVK